MNSINFEINAETYYGFSEKELSKAKEYELVAMQLIFFAESLFWFISNQANELKGKSEINTDVTFSHFEQISHLGIGIIGTLSGSIADLYEIAEKPAITVPTIKSVESGNIVKSLNDFSNDFSLLDAELQKKAYRQFSQFWENFKNSEVKNA